MKKNILLLLAVAALTLASRAHSDPITGSFATAGIHDATFNPSSLNLTKGGMEIGPESGGSVAGLGGLVSLRGFSFDDASGTQLFNVGDSGASPITFTIEGQIADAIVGGILTIPGSGISTQTGYQATKGDFFLSVSGNGSRSAVKITAFSAPEPGSLLLLGTGLLALALLVFWKAKTSSHTLGNAQV